MEPGQQKKTYCSAIGKAAIAVTCDVSDEAQIEAAAKTVLAKYPAVHILLNGAAGNDPNGTVLELTLAEWNKVFGVNVGGAFLMSRAILPAMIKAGGGSIIHIASQLGSVAGRAARSIAPARARCSSSPRRWRPIMRRRTCG